MLHWLHRLMWRLRATWATSCPNRRHENHEAEAAGRLLLELDAKTQRSMDQLQDNLENAERRVNARVDYLLTHKGHGDEDDANDGFVGDPDTDWPDRVRGL